MNLALDIGNSLTKLAIFDNNDKLVFKHVCDFLPIDELREILDKYPIEHSIFSTVSKSYYNIESLLTERYSFIKFDHTTPVPVNNLYQTPETLGKDRVAAIVGAQSLYPDNDLLVIDAGTCVTYDYINEKGDYLGGNISPGLSIRFKALNNYTENLPLLEKQEIDYLVGNTTDRAILSGVIRGLAAEIDGMILAYVTKYPEIKTVVTGGDANFFDSYLKSSIFAVPNLVLIGLNKIIQYNLTGQNEA